MILESYISRAPDGSREEDPYAAPLYQRIFAPAASPASPMVQVTVTARTATDKVAMELIPQLIPEARLPDVRHLLDYYLRTREVLHFLNDSGERFVSSCMLVASEVVCVTVKAERIARDDEDVRRSKFRDSANAMGLGNPDTDLDLSDFGPRDPNWSARP